MDSIYYYVKAIFLTLAKPYVQENFQILNWNTIFEAIFFQKINFSQCPKYIWNQHCPRNSKITLLLKFEENQNLSFSGTLCQKIKDISTYMKSNHKSHTILESWEYGNYGELKDFSFLYLVYEKIGWSVLWSPPGKRLATREY